MLKNKTTKILSNFCRLGNSLRISKKAQLGILESKFFFIGFIIAVILAFVLIFLANKGILIPFKLSFLCP